MLASERKMLYAFLSMLFRTPDEETVATLRGLDDETFEPVFPGLSPPPLSNLAELRDGYEQLFTPRPGGAPVPPYGSAYLESSGNSGSFSRIVSIFYTSAGLDSSASPEPVDYLPTQLEFLYYLTEGEEQSLAQEIDIPPQRWLASQADFLKVAVVPWIDSFCDRIQSTRGAHPFYRWAAELLGRFVAMEQGRLQAV
jgi:putative dimethyl sulfoxide reductase chaperone